MLTAWTRLPGLQTTLWHGADAPKIVCGSVGRVGEYYQHHARASGVGRLRQPVGRCQSERAIQRVIGSGDARKGQTHFAAAQKLGGDLIATRVHDNLFGPVDFNCSISGVSVFAKNHVSACR